jgi:type VII secretion protein EccE
MKKFAGPPRPGAARTTLAVATVVVVALAVEWSDGDLWWWVAGGAAALVVLAAWWRGLHLTTIVRRRAALFARNRGWRGREAAPIDVRTTVLLRVISGPGAVPPEKLPLPAIASYLDRYGVRCTAIRVTHRLPDGLTLVSLTVGAVDNLAALRARSARLPLHETAVVLRRRLADELGEMGWRVQPVEDVAAGDTPLGSARRPERWRCVPTADGFVAAYRRAAPNAPQISELTTDLPGELVWTVLELTGSPDRPAVTVAYAVKSADRPSGSTPAGLTLEAGRQWPALQAMDPASTTPLVGPSARPVGLSVEHPPAPVRA